MKTCNLMLHCGAAKVEREQVESSRTPDRTDTWVPVAHHKLLSSVETALSGVGLNVVNQAHGLTRDGNRYFGLLQVANGHNSDDFGLIVGIRNSHDRSFPASIVIGAQVFVCDNLSFSGEVKLARKHTVHIERDLPQLVHRSVGLLSDLRNTQERRIQSYQTTELTDGQAHNLVIRCLDAGVVPVTKIPDLLKEWRTPRHPEFAQEKNVWRIHNAATEILKGRLGELPKRCEALHGILDAYAGLVIPQTKVLQASEVEVVAAG